MLETGPARLCCLYWIPGRKMSLIEVEAGRWSVTEGPPTLDG